MEEILLADDNIALFDNIEDDVSSISDDGLFDLDMGDTHIVDGNREHPDMLLDDDEDDCLCEWEAENDAREQAVASTQLNTRRNEPSIENGSLIEFQELVPGVMAQHEDEEGEDRDLDHQFDCCNERVKVMARLEGLVLSFIEQLVDALKESQPKKQTKRIVLALADRSRTSTEGLATTRTLRFPRNGRGASIKPFAQLFRVVDLMHEALANDIPMTKRDMYYKDVELFKSQAVVDKLVDDLAASLDLGRADLHVRASSKGLVCGSKLEIHLGGGDKINVNDGEGTLIPPGEDITRLEVDQSLSWVLIVEKEAVFQTLCRLRFASDPGLPGPGIIITGKGYPDVATRQLVKTLSDNLPSHIPILALVDGDAYGLDILSVYRFGSVRMQYEKENLAAERVRWLGIWTSELGELGVPKDALISMTKHDEKKALSMLRRSSLPKKWRCVFRIGPEQGTHPLKELQYMLHNRRKAEIEVLPSAPSRSNAAWYEGASGGGLSSSDDLAALSGSTPCLATYLVDKISAVVAHYELKCA